MEVKAIEGLGKAVDAILVNGRLAAGDMVVLGGQSGPICTHIKQIYTPPANKDLRVKQQWIKHTKEWAWAVLLKSTSWIINFFP